MPNFDGPGFDGTPVYSVLGSLSGHSFPKVRSNLLHTCHGHCRRYSSNSQFIGAVQVHEAIEGQYFYSTSRPVALWYLDSVDRQVLKVLSCTA